MRISSYGLMAAVICVVPGAVLWSAPAAQAAQAAPPPAPHQGAPTRARESSGTPPHPAPHRGASPTAGDPDIDPFVQTELEAQNIVGLALGVVVDGTPYYLAGYGYEDRSRFIAVSPGSSLFRWASVSKTITAVAAMTLVEEGALDLDQDIRTWYPTYDLPEQYIAAGDVSSPSSLQLEPLPDDTTLTLRLLLGHLAGVQHYDNGLAQVTPPPFRRNNPNVNTGFEWALERWVDAPLISLPGETYSYSSPGFNLAGAVVGAAYAAEYGLDLPADKAYTALVADRIAQGSGAVGLQPDYQWEALDHRAVGYLITDSGGVIRDSNSDVSWKLPSGGFVSTATDAARYCAALTDSRLLESESREMMWTKQHEADGSSTGYGLGFGIGSRGGHRRVAHNGEQEKASSRLVLYPDEGLCIVILTNTRYASGDRSLDLSRIADGVEDIVRAR